MDCDPRKNIEACRSTLNSYLKERHELEKRIDMLNFQIAGMMGHINAMESLLSKKDGDEGK